MTCALLAEELTSVDHLCCWSHQGCGALTAGGMHRGLYKAIGGPKRLWVKLWEKRGTGLAAKLRVTQEATAVSDLPYACDCRVTCSYHIKEFIFFLLRVSEKLQKLDESMRYQAQRSANEHGAR